MQSIQEEADGKAEKKDCERFAVYCLRQRSISPGSFLHGEIIRIMIILPTGDGVSLRPHLPQEIWPNGEKSMWSGFTMRAFFHHNEKIQTIEAVIYGNRLDY